eukprot:TRINITY_DN15640_c0_g1_i2.p1 TRINITY_DN15640_c0_g1~~TRINITY_DN15640_c0_g1_i2.p1  ORF type:complete len:396 (+),score=89.58 TRINITY_DN15640_c0_g1_i2:204-1391(+)
MRELLEGDGTCMFLYGPPGTGKTALTKTLLAERTASNARNTRLLHLTCTSIRSTAALMSHFSTWVRSKEENSVEVVWRNMVEEFFRKEKQAKKWYLVLDEVDYLLGTTKSKKVKASSAITKSSTCEQILDTLMAMAMETNNAGNLHIVTISNEKAATCRAIERIPAEHRFAFKPYTSQQLVGIINGRLGEAECDSGEVFDEKSVLFMSMKTANNSGGDCRALLENLRRTLSNRDGEETVSIADVQKSLPFRNEMLLWLKSLGSGERLLLVCAVVMASKVKPPYRVPDLSAAFHGVLNRFLTCDSSYGTDPAAILSVLNQITATHGFMELTSTGNAKKKQKREVDLATHQITLKDTLTPEKLYTSLQAIENSGTGASSCSLLIEILEYYFPKYTEW